MIISLQVPRISTEQVDMSLLWETIHILKFCRKSQRLMHSHHCSRVSACHLYKPKVNPCVYLRSKERGWGLSLVVECLPGQAQGPGFSPRSGEKKEARWTIKFHSICATSANACACLLFWGVVVSVVQTRT